MLHGGDGPAAHLPFATMLSGGFELIHPTHPGFDGSPIPEHFDGLQDLVFLYLDLIDSLDLRDAILMGFSMGGWLAMEAVRQLAIRNGGHVPKKLSNIILASPDIDVDVFVTQLNQIGEASRRITIFTATDDVALDVSRRIAGSDQRLGSIDITRPFVRKALLQRGIAAIDLSAATSSDGLNHINFADSPEMVTAIGERLAAGDDISGSHPGLAETVGATALGAAQGVGSAIGAGLTAPVAVIDPEARRRLGRQRVRDPVPHQQFPAVPVGAQDLRGMPTRRLLIRCGPVRGHQRRGRRFSPPL